MQPEEEEEVVVPPAETRRNTPPAARVLTACGESQPRRRAHSGRPSAHQPIGGPRPPEGPQRRLPGIRWEKGNPESEEAKSQPSRRPAKPAPPTHVRCPLRQRSDCPLKRWVARQGENRRREVGSGNFTSSEDPTDDDGAHRSQPCGRADFLVANRHRECWLRVRGVEREA